MDELLTAAHNGLYCMRISLSSSLISLNGQTDDDEDDDDEDDDDEEEEEEEEKKEEEKEEEEDIKLQLRGNHYILTS
ncbi:hypothetical protein DPMN_160513 [Dreissena polymorpha]|uniref:Uncharacterized protein n=1 Tax=Dreissena polymorpha TaxID=45954 RepID=A0A9D4EMZ1_DREPO|nr:hypothetical protein DPMN_160513 [Dreissena polymorpha]